MSKFLKVRFSLLEKKQKKMINVFVFYLSLLFLFFTFRSGKNSRLWTRTKEKIILTDFWKLWLFFIVKLTKNSKMGQIFWVKMKNFTEIFSSVTLRCQILLIFLKNFVWLSSAILHVVINTKIFKIRQFLKSWNKILRANTSLHKNTQKGRQR